MRWFDASPRRATPKGQQSFISCTAPRSITALPHVTSRARGTPENQRLAMAARDLGCSFPGCIDPPSRCEAHHLTDYALTRRTSIDDGTLLCGWHHREHPRLGWTCQMINGRPHWIAPPWLDRTQTPIRNHAHDPLEE